MKVAALSLVHEHCSLLQAMGLAAMATEWCWIYEVVVQSFLRSLMWKMDKLFANASVPEPWQMPRLLDASLQTAPGKETKNEYIAVIDIPLYKFWQFKYFKQQELRNTVQREVAKLAYSSTWLATTLITNNMRTFMKVGKREFNSNMKYMVNWTYD